MKRSSSWKTAAMVVAILGLVVGYAIKPASADCPHRGRLDHAHCRPDPGETRFIVTLDGGEDDYGHTDPLASPFPDPYAIRQVCSSDAMSPGVPVDGVEGLGNSDVPDDNNAEFFSVSFRLKRISGQDPFLTDIEWPGKDTECDQQPNFTATSGSVQLGRNKDTGLITEYTLHFTGSSPKEGTAQTAGIEFVGNPLTDADGDDIPANDLAGHIADCMSLDPCFIIHLHADAEAVLRKSKFIGTVSAGDLTFSLP